MEFDKKKPNPNPWSRASFVSRLFFWWLVPLLFKGWKGNLKDSDIYDCPDDDSSRKLGLMMQREWEKELKKLQKGDKPNLLKATIRAFGIQQSVIVFYLMIEQYLIDIGRPILMVYLISHFARMNLLSVQDLSLCAALMILLAVMCVFVQNYNYFKAERTGMQFRIAFSTLFYKKALKLSQATLSGTTVGQLINLFSNDIGRYERAFLYIPFLVVGPIHVIIIMVLLWTYIGYAALAGISAFILYIPLQWFLAKLFSKLRIKAAVLTDERMHLMNEIIGGMRVIKLYGWEIPFAKLVELSRRKEMKKIQRTTFLRGLNLATCNIASKIMLFITFMVFVLVMQGEMTPDKVFISMSLFESLRFTMVTCVPMAISQGADFIVSLKRIQKFLLLEEQSQTSLQDISNLRPKLDHCGLWLTKATTSFNKNSKSTLHNLTLTVLPGELLMVIGPVGGGKTSLLMSILGELVLTSGDIKVRGKIAYASQENWVFGGSIRQNIIFGNVFDEVKYMKVLNVCCLDKDIDLFPYGDQTAVGESGVLLSGGQKARVNLARALYSDADIFLLDDPLSAVDSSVSKQLFNKCINGYIKDKIRILVTHQIQFLKGASKILILEDGCCLGYGTYKELIESGVNLGAFLGEHKHQGHLSTSIITSTITNIVEEISDDGTLLPFYKSSTSINAADQHECDVPIREREERVQKEVPELKSTGSISFSVYKEYVKSGAGPLLIFIVLFSYIGTQVLSSGSSFWLAGWTSLEQLKINVRDCWSQANKTFLREAGFYDGIVNNSFWPDILPRDNALCFRITENFTLDYYDAEQKVDIQYQLSIYSGFILGLFLLSILQTTSFFAMCMKASITLHNKMFCSVLRSPIAFFDNNPVGRVLNRFAKDTGILDETLPMITLNALTLFSTAMGVVCVVAIVEPYFLLPTLVMASICVLLRKFYIPTARDVKRYEGIARSPMYSHLSISLHGLTTIRAFKVQPSFEVSFDHHQDQHTATWFTFISLKKWFAIHLDLFYVLYFTMVIIAMILLSEDSAFASRAGLAIVSASELCTNVSFCLNTWTEAENQITSVERVIEYSNLKPEADLEGTEKDNLPKNWPEKGHIVYEDVNLRYGIDEPYVLKNLKFEIFPEEKIGIVGRTGAGKSSIITTLFRMTEPEGLIKVDGIATKYIRLNILRKKISIIPQDPILFTGPIRRNLDPFSEYTDSELWHALDEAHLKKNIEEMPGGLNTKVSEGGSNFSVGQRQLICLARAIIRRNKILVLDEATANVDPNTDSLIQQTIRDRFAHCTVLTIAHRLHTIMDSDRVLVLDDGEIKEFDEPYSLLQNPDSLFSFMVEMTGPSTSTQLKNIAYKTHLKGILNVKNEGVPKVNGRKDVTELEVSSTDARQMNGCNTGTEGLVNESYEHTEQTFL